MNRVIKIRRGAKDQRKKKEENKIKQGALGSKRSGEKNSRVNAGNSVEVEKDNVSTSNKGENEHASIGGPKLPQFTP